MKNTKNPEFFETTIFNAKTDMFVPYIVEMEGKYTTKENITAQWLKKLNGELIHIRQEGKKVVIEHAKKMPNSCSQIASFQKSRIPTENFRSAVEIFLRVGFSSYRETYKKFRYTYVNEKNAAIGKVQFNFDTYEYLGEKSAPVLKIVAETKESIYKIANSMKLDPSELRGIGSLDAFNYIYPEIKKI